MKDARIVVKVEGFKKELLRDIADYEGVTITSILDKIINQKILDYLSNSDFVNSRIDKGGF